MCSIQFSQKVLKIQHVLYVNLSERQPTNKLVDSHEYCRVYRESRYLLKKKKKKKKKEKK